MLPKIYFSIPVLNEEEYLYKTLNCIAQQDYDGEIETFICVNQPQSWWNEPQKKEICIKNQQTLQNLQNGYKNLKLTLIDKSSNGNGWQDKKSGVGIARKTLGDAISSVAKNNDIFISMDADTAFEKTFVSSIVSIFKQDPKTIALSLPYYHPLSDNESQNRAILYYEIYMRNYLINLLRIKSPHAFTALGSAIACSIKTYKIVGGFDSQMAGEDFYFLQKIVKYGTLRLYSKDIVYPSCRFSDRVPFGTGKAVTNFDKGEQERYPIFHHTLFSEIEKTYKQINQLFIQDISLPFLDFLHQHCFDSVVWTRLRNNYKTEPLFHKAFHHKVDGLRIFQYLRHAQKEIPQSDEACLKDFLSTFSNDMQEIIPSDINFQTSPVSLLARIRDFLFEEEMKLRRNNK